MNTSYIGGINFNIMTKNQLVNSIITHDNRARSTLMRKTKQELIELYQQYMNQVAEQIIPVAPVAPEPYVPHDVYAELLKRIRFINLQRDILLDLQRLENGQIDTVINIPVNLYGSLDQTIFNLIQRLVGRQFVIEYGNNIYTLNINNVDRLLRLIRSNMTDTEDSTASDQQFVMHLLNVTSFNIIELYQPRHMDDDGAFFKYLTVFNKRCLKRYGIYHTFKSKNYNMNCFYNTMEKSNLPVTKLNELKTLIKGESVPLSSMKTICEQLEIRLIIKKLRLHSDKYECLNKKYGIEGDEYTICLVDNHYFPYDKETKFTSFSIKNYDKIKSFNNWNKICRFLKNGKPSRSNKKVVDSLNLVKLLLENKDSVLKHINKDIEVLNSNLNKSLFDDEFKDLSYPDTAWCIPGAGPLCQNFKNDGYYNHTFKEGTKPTNYRKIFFDFETYSHGDKKIHKPYLCSYYDAVTSKVHTFHGSNCAYNMLKSLPENCLLLAHNAGYDFRFIYQHILIDNYLPSGKSLFQATGSFFKAKGKSIKLIIKDTYKHISAPLSRFGKMFNLPVQKEVMPHELVTIHSLKAFTSFSELKSYFKNDEESYKIMTNNIINWDLMTTKMNNDTWFQLKDYSAKYCEMDCIVLAQGYNIFRNNIHSVTSLDIDDYISIASIGDSYLKHQGVYNGSVKLSGVPRAFIQKCVVGGRTMSARNEKFELFNWDGADFDAVSLYPSAMERLGGILLGLPKVLQNNELTYDFLKKQDGYFIQIRIKSIGKHRDFPLISKFTDKGVRLFNNNMENEVIYIDKISLEDLIEFQEVSFEVIRGYYFNEGRNNKLKEVITFLFNQRLIAKAEKNPIEQIYKLLMNSSYGKSILKPVENKIKVFNNKSSLLKFLSNHFNLIKETVRITNNKKEEYNKYYVKLSKHIGKHMNSVHFGCEILSMSKRIMNEVMCTAEDIGLQIYYQDTDSMHISNNDVKILSEYYNKKYNRELIGKKMGQFHVDFDLDGAITSSIRATDTIILGKKCYIDKLIGQDNEGNDIHGYHVRMKGVTNNSIMYTAKGDLMDLYSKLYNGDTIAFDLCCGGSVKMFNFHNDMSVSFIDGITDNGFIRTLSF